MFAGNSFFRSVTHTVKPRYNAVSGRHILRPRYKRGALYVLPPVFFFFFFFLILYIFFDCKLLYLLCTLPRCTFTTHYVYCIFIPICFIDLSSVIKIDVPNKWASVQPAIADG